MSTRLPPARPGQTAPPAPNPVVGSAAAPPNILTLESHLLCSLIALPHDYLISYACFTPIQSIDSHQTIDRARKLIFEGYSNRALEDSVLSYTHLDGNSSFLWLFSFEGRVGEGDTGESFTGRLNDIRVPGLTRSNIETFRYCDIYPCSSSCSLQRHPCSKCLLTAQTLPSSYRNSRTDPENSQPSPAATPSITTTCCIPREPLRRPIAFLVNAVRERLLYDICKKASSVGKPVMRLKDGLIWSLCDEGSNWIDGWEQHGNARPLPFCRVEITLFPSGLLVTPHIMLTGFVPFIPSLAPIPGTPINLLPFSTPAYYLNLYAGPTSALIKQFDASLNGLVPEGLLRANRDFVIAWISVQNKQGDEKGIMVIWPACLCVSLLPNTEGTEEKSSSASRPPTYAYNRRALPFLPDMPLALQPSPVPAHAAVPTQRSISPRAAVSPSVFTTGESGLFSSKEPSPQLDLQASATATVAAATEMPPFSRIRRVRSIPTSRAYRALTSSQHLRHDIGDVAVGAGKYVDAVAKERERERDRIRREREASTSGQANKESPLQQTVDTPDVGASISFQQLPTPGHVIMSSMNTPSSAALAAQLVSSPAYASPLATQIAQPVYPSPPDEVVSREHSIPQPLSADFTTPGGIYQQQTIPKTEPFDAFSSMDNFMNDINLGYGMSVSKAVTHEAVISPVQNQVDYDAFGAFTDDDFNFFDDPIGTTVIAASDGKPAIDAVSLGQMQPLGNDDVLKAFEIAPPFTADFLLNSLSATDSLFSPTVPTELATPKTSVGNVNTPFIQENQVAPELVHCPSERSSMSPTGPLTPETISVIPPEVANDNPFQPIHFDDRLQEADAKYISGKFSFPTEGKLSDEELLARKPGQRGLYTLATDPGIGLMRKLIGMKRRKTLQGRRHSVDILPDRNVYDDAISIGDEESGDEKVSDSEESDEEDPATSRPSTPLPSYVPLGPTLVATHFIHSLLFPLSVSLRPPGSAFADAGIQSPLPNPVPTPVSPSATTGHAKDRRASIESFVHALCLEVIENGAWADEWRLAHSSDKGAARRGFSGNEDAFDGKYLFSCGWMYKPLSIGSISDLIGTRAEPDSATLVPLPQPMLSIGKSQSILNIAPPALRFWAKLGLSPRSGAKDVTTFILFEDGGDMSMRAEIWLKRVSDIYKAKGYGSHVPGKMPGYEKEGLLPIHFATFRRTFAGFVDSLGAQAHLPILFYVAISATHLSSRTATLQHIFAALKSASADSRRNIYYHLVPSSLLSGEDDAVMDFKTELIADNLYNKIKRPVSRLMSRPIFVQDEGNRRLFEAPSFALSRGPPSTKSIFTDYSSTPADVLERHTFLHVGYKLSDDRKWLVAAAIDQNGENHDIKVWCSDSEYNDEECVKFVWHFAIEFARQAQVEWRLVIAKLGPFDRTHLEAWNIPLSKLIATKRAIPIQVTILSVEDSGWSVAEQGPASVRASAQSAPNDAYLKRDTFSSSSVFFSLSHFFRLPLSPSRTIDIGADQNHVTEGDSLNPQGERLLPMQTAVLIGSSTERPTSTRALYIHMLANAKSPGSTVGCTENDTHAGICQSYHDLAVLTKLRWRLPTRTDLPFHIAALQVVDEVLERFDSMPEG